MTAQKHHPALILGGVLLLHAALVHLLLRHDYDSAPVDEGVPMRYMEAIMIQPVARGPATVVPAPVKPHAVTADASARSGTESKRVPPQTVGRVANVVQGDPTGAAITAGVTHVPAPDHFAASDKPAPMLSIEAMRQMARNDERRREKTPVEQIRAAELAAESRGAVATRVIGRAKRADCKTAYSGGTAANLFVLIPLAIDTVTDTGCKW